MPSALSPQSATAHSRATLITVASTQSAGRNSGTIGANAVSISA